VVQVEQSVHKYECRIVKISLNFNSAHKLQLSHRQTFLYYFLTNKELFYILGLKTSVTCLYFVSGYTNKATTLEIRKFSEKLNYLNFPSVNFFNMCRAGDFDVNYIFLNHISLMYLK
jgi:hypothetical protein